MDIYFVGTKAKVNILTAVLIIIIAISVYLMVFQAYHHDGQWLAALCIALLFISILALQFLWIDLPDDSFWDYRMRALAVTILMLPIGYGLFCAENRYEEKNLDLHGINATVFITYTHSNKGKGGIFYEGDYQYQYNGETYTHTLGSYHHTYVVGDTVRIIFSTEHPNIDKVLSYKSIGY